MAIAGMNGQWLGGRALRTNWATGKGGGSTQRSQTSELKQSEFAPVMIAATVVGLQLLT